MDIKLIISFFLDLITLTFAIILFVHQVGYGWLNNVDYILGYITGYVVGHISSKFFYARWGIQ